MDTPSIEFRKLFLPYCLIRLADGRYIVTNRSYKPLGTLDFTTYETHPSTRTIRGLTAAKIAKIDYRGAADEDGRIYLYNDGCVPTASPAHWKAYAARLEALAKLQVE